MKQIFKRILSVLLVVVLLIGISPLAEFDFSGLFSLKAFAASSGVDGGIEWRLSGTSLSMDRTLTISPAANPQSGFEPGQMRDYESGSSTPWFDTYNRTLVINNGVKNIGAHAFLESGRLQNITIASSVETIGEYAFSNCDCECSQEKNYFTQITIPDSVKVIESYAFYRCSHLKTVNMGNGVTSIGNCAFEYCKSLTSIEIPNSVTSIGNWAFYGCTSLTSIEIPNSVTSIGNYAFYNCTSLRSIEIPNSVTSIGNYAFEDCTSLTSIEIPNSVTSIGYGTFYNCTSLTSIEIPNSVTSIGRSAFYECTGLTSVTIGNSVASIGTSAFYNCWRLTDLYFNGTLSDWLKITFVNKMGNPNFYADNLYFNGEIVDQLVIPNGITSIGDFAFVGCGISSITIPEGVTDINFGAFDFCHQLENIILPKSLTRIYPYAFHECSKLTNVYYLGTEEQWNEITIGDGNEPLLNAIKFPEPPVSWQTTLNPNGGSVEPTSFITPDRDSFILPTPVRTGFICLGWATSSSATKAEYSCGESYTPDSNEELFAVWDSEKRCGDNLTWDFDESTGTLTISGTGDMWDWNGWADVPWYSNRERIKKITIENQITSIGKYAFNNCKNMTTVMIPDSVTDIGNSAFINCESLSDITFSDRITCIGDWAFNSCSSLASVIIPASVTSIGWSPFCNCKSLTNITVCEDNQYYSSNSDGVLFNKTMTKLIQYPKGSIRNSYIIPDTVTEIGVEAFYNCVNLTDITIGSNVRSISDCSFYSCDNLNKVTIQTSVISIGNQVFDSCSNLTDIYYSGTEEQWQNILNKTANNEPLMNANIHFKENPHGTCGDTLNWSFNPSTGVLEITGSGLMSFGDSALSPWNEFRSKITSISLPDGLTSICENAFLGIVTTDIIDIPESVQNVEKNAFSNYSSTSVRFNNPNCIINDPGGSFASAVIYGYVGSTADSYAEMFNAVFNPISTTDKIKVTLNAERNGGKINGLDTYIVLLPKENGKATIDLSKYTAQKTDYSCTGWSTSSISTGSFGIKTSAKDTVYYAVFKRTVTVGLYTKNGCVSHDVILENTIRNTEEGEIKLPVEAEEDGFIPLGWTTKTTAETVPSYEMGENFPVEHSVNLYMLYENSSAYKAHYNNNTGDETESCIITESIPYRYNSSDMSKGAAVLTIPNTMPSRNGYIFVGWSRSDGENLNTERYFVGDQVYIENEDINANNGNINYYAVWIPEEDYSSSFAGNVSGNSYNFLNDRKYFGNDYTIPSKYIDSLKNYGLTEGELTELDKKMKSEWNGSCYGMSVTAALYYAGYMNGGLDKSELLGSQKEQLSEYGTPLENSNIKDVINYYQLLQYVRDIDDDPMFHSYKSWKSIYLKDLIRNISSSEYPVVVVFSGTYKNKPITHSVLAYAVEQGKDETGNDGYLIYVIDPNQSGSVKLFIKSDFSEAKFTNDVYKDIYIYYSEKVANENSSRIYSQFNLQKITTSESQNSTLKKSRLYASGAKDSSINLTVSEFENNNYGKAILETNYLNFVLRSSDGRYVVVENGESVEGDIEISSQITYSEFSDKINAVYWLEAPDTGEYYIITQDADEVNACTGEHLTEYSTTFVNRDLQNGYYLTAETECAGTTEFYANGMVVSLCPEKTQMSVSSTLNNSESEMDCVSVSGYTSGLFLNLSGTDCFVSSRSSTEFNFNIRSDNTVYTINKFFDCRVEYTIAVSNHEVEITETQMLLEKKNAESDYCKLTIEKTPDKTDYICGEKPDFTGMVLLYSCGDQTEYVTQGYECEVNQLTELGRRALFVNYNGCAVPLTVSVYLGIVPKSDSTVVIDRDKGIISGITGNLKTLNSFVQVSDDSLTLKYDTDTIGTGTTVNVCKNGNIIDFYKTVIFGDVNGDGWYDGADSIIVNCLANGLLSREQVGEAVYMAADCNHDDVIDEADVALLEQAGLILASVDQSKSPEELVTDSAYVEYLDLIDQNPVEESVVDDILNIVTTGEKSDKDSSEADTVSPEKTENKPVDEVINRSVIQKVITFITYIFRMIIAYIPKAV